MFKTFFLSFVTLISSLGSIFHINKSVIANLPDRGAEAISDSQVLAAVTDTSQEYSTPSPVTFTVNVPANFKQGITSPNLLYSLTGGVGIRVSNTDTQNPILSLNLVAGDGITIDGNKITNSGIKSLAAGDGITIDGNKITNAGIKSLSAGTNISIDGNKITNTYTAPAVDYTQSGWTDNGTSITLTTTTDTITMDTVTAGDITADSLTTSGLALAGGLTVTSGNSILPDTDLGSDLGSSSKRFNNLWVANINSNSSQAFSGQTTFSYAPTDTTISQASVLINPTTAAASGQLLGLAIAGYQKALIDEDGDIILGYSDATSAPASDYPLNIYGHSGTRVSFVDTAGNLSIGTGLSSTGALSITPLAGSNLNIALSTTGDFAVNTNQLYVDTSAGRVGIGTTSPGYKLHVDGEIRSNSKFSVVPVSEGTALEIYSSGGLSTITGSAWGSGSSLTMQTVSGQLIFKAKSGGSNDGIIQFYTGTTTTNAIAMTIAESHNVGIGTTSPGFKLEVSDGARFGAGIGIGANPTLSTADGTSYFRLFAQGVNNNESNIVIRNSSSDSAGRSAGIYFAPSTAFTGTSEAGSGAVIKALEGAGVTTALTFTTYNGTDVSERMRIHTSGNVGIGTTNPAYKLDVNGDAQINGVIVGRGGTNSPQNNSALGVFTLQFNQSGGIYNTGVGGYAGYTNQTGDNNTSVGYAANYAHTGSDNTVVGYWALSNATTGGGNTVIGSNTGLGITTGSYNTIVGAAVSGLSSSLANNIIIADGQGNQRIRIDSSGNVGIGTTAPATSLHLGSDAGTAASGIKFGSDVNLYRSAANMLKTDDNLTSAGYIYTTSTLYADASVLVPLLRARMGTGAYISLNSTGGVSIINEYGTAYIPLTVKGMAAQTGNLTEWKNSSGTVLSVVDAAGKFGIGTTAPAYALDVKAAGTGIIARFNNDNTSGCTIADGGTISCSSDRTLKKNIDTLSYGLTDLLKLNPVDFNWNFEGDDKTKSLGFIAQDVEAVIPGLVSIDSNGLRSLNTIGLVPVLAKAIQQQQLQLDGLSGSALSATVSAEYVTVSQWHGVTDLIDSLQSMIDDLRSTISNLSTKFTTKEICLENTCINQDQLKKILDNLPTPTPTPEITITTEITITPESTPSASPSATITP